MRLIKVGKAAEMLGVSVQTLRAWQESGELLPDRISAGGRRYYDADKLAGLSQAEAVTVAYARVSSNDQKEDLVRQKTLLESFCTARGWRFQSISDLGSGMNYRKKGLGKLLEMILQRQLRRLVLTHKDRLLRFGAELVFALCELQSVEVVIINKGEQPSFEQELAQDVLEIITVFSARLYGNRSHKAKKLIEQFKEGCSLPQDPPETDD
jgi:predicted site-specific integrase-resolvase